MRDAEGVKPPLWCKVLIYISIPWAFSIHTVTAFLYAGLAARGFWLTAIMAPRFLGSAFAAGPALLIVLCYILKKFDGFDAGDEAIKALSKIVAYAMVASLFFFGCELFTVYYSQVPEHMYHFKYMFVGLHGHVKMVPFMWLSAILAIGSTVLLVIPNTRNNKTILPIACVMAFVALWLEKGLALIVVGFIPSMLETVTEYLPTFRESAITLGIWAIGALILTLLYKVAMGVKREVAS